MGKRSIDRRKRRQAKQAERYGVPVKTRRHHNNDGRRQIQRGKTRDQVRAMAARLGVPYGAGAV